MPTKLSRYNEGIMEAAWLAAVILVPVFFNVYSSRIFEPDKIAILRTLSLIIIGAWIVKLIDERGVLFEQLDPGDAGWKSILKIPLIAPVLALSVLYVIATIFSINPQVSLFGSYQRLQGTYTTFSYLVIFAAIVGNLRKRNQVERLVTVIILTSLPVVLYGVLQRYKIDPIPWGGDTSIRIAANMGNSIFVAAYLIMVFPLTIGRIVDSFRSILADEQSPVVHVMRATAYVFIAALQVIAVYMSGSRGPALGWMAGSFFLFLLLSLYWNKRWLTILTVGVALALGVFLLVFNIENGPLETLRSSPAVGRFGNLLNAESNSALVRKYIWQGAAELVTPHEPLKYPDGREDTINIVRPLIGYGPESMYVAYNPFYVPELANVERRNASPDRSHNETWDSLVITGVLGIIVYLILFLSVFYYGLKWNKLIADDKQRNLFFVLTIGGGAVTAIGLSLWRGLEYFGVAIPFGILLGFLLYITITALFYSYDPPATLGEKTRSITLIVLLSAIVAHFIEINFGIAIAATRTYFWVFAALLLVVGYILPLYNEYEEGRFVTGQDEEKTVSGRSQNRYSSKRKRQLPNKSAQPYGGVDYDHLRNVLIPALLCVLLLVTLGYNFISNPRAMTSGVDILWTSLTKLPNYNFATSFGILAMMLITWVFFNIVMISEEETATRVASWLKIIAVALGISGVVILTIWFWQAGALANMAKSNPTDLSGVLDQVERYINLLSRFYLVIYVFILILGAFLPSAWPAKEKNYTRKGAIAGPLALIIVTILASYSNLRVIQADIVFKLAEPFTRSNQWPVAIAVYDHANELAPNEDYYYLFLGRAYLEYAKTLADENDRNLLISQAEQDLKNAQNLNPLNTDHTANLARLFSLWASFVQDPAERIVKANISAEYFSKAVTLSPKNARIWDEWALLYLNILNQPQEAYQRMMNALDIDPDYHWTYGLLSEYYTRNSKNQNDPETASSDLKMAATYLNKALELRTPGEPDAKYGYALSLGGIETQLGNYLSAIEAYNTAIEQAPSNADTWKIEEAIVTLYVQLGDYNHATTHALNAISLAPDDQKERLQNLLDQLLQAQP